MPRQHYDWPAVHKEIDSIVSDFPDITYRRLSILLGIPVTTLHDHVSLGKVKGDIRHDPATAETLAKQAGIDASKFEVASFAYTVREDEYGDVHRSSRMTVKPIVDLETIRPIRVVINDFDVPMKLHTPGNEHIALILPDIHFGYGANGPFHDVQALEKVLEYVAKNPLDKIVVLGDVLDLPEFTDKFPSRPEYIQTTQMAINSAGVFFASLRAVAGDTKIIVIEGNHDYRISAMLHKYMMPLAGLRPAGKKVTVSVPWLLNFEELNIEYIEGWPDNVYRIGDVKILHGDIVSSEPGQTVGKMLQKYGASTVFGHIHRREYAENSAWSDSLDDYKRIFAYSPGCLCRVDGAVPGSTTPNNWRQGMGLLVTDEHDSFIIDIPFSQGRFLT